MPNFGFTKNYADGVDLTEQQLDDAFESVESFLNTTKIDQDNIQSGGISSDNLATGAVTTVKLGTNSVTTVKITDLNVTTAKIADGAITAAKLAQSAIDAFEVQAGTIHAYAGTSAPTGYLLCDGSTVSRTTYADLYAITGDAYGEGDGSTTFHLPDFRGKFLRGLDSGAGNDPDAGSRTASNTGGNIGDAIGSLQADDLKSHSHVVEGGADGTGTNAHETTNGSGFFGLSSELTGGNETRPKNVYVNYIIKT